MLVMATFDKIKCINHIAIGRQAGVALNLLVWLPRRAQIEWFMPQKTRSAKVIIARFYSILN